MTTFIDITGRKFNKLKVIKRVENNKGGRARWLCQCDCGSEPVVVDGYNLRKGVTKSCGCYNLEQIKQRSVKHGLGKRRVYRIYKAMKQRCYNVNNQKYEYYGGKGIVICNEWLGEEGAVNFYNWSVANGYKDGLTIDRLDVNGNYEPSNCKWATRKEQANNKTSNVMIEIDGISKTIAQWSEGTGISDTTIWRRFNTGVKGMELIKKPRELNRNPELKYILKEKSSDKWKVQINKLYLGLFKTLEEAQEVRDTYVKKNLKESTNKSEL